MPAERITLKCHHFLLVTLFFTTLVTLCYIGRFIGMQLCNTNAAYITVIYLLMHMHVYMRQYYTVSSPYTAPSRRHLSQDTVPVSPEYVRVALCALWRPFTKCHIYKWLCAGGPLPSAICAGDPLPSAIPEWLCTGDPLPSAILVCWRPFTKCHRVAVCWRPFTKFHN